MQLSTLKEQEQITLDDGTVATVERVFPDYAIISYYDRGGFVFQSIRVKAPKE
jgi:hypothetical protein